jgi:hypothetical protein
MRAIGYVTLILLAAPRTAHAQEAVAAASSPKLFLLTGVQYSKPTRVSADLGFLVAKGDSRSEVRGFFLEGGVGQEGVRAAAGLGVWGIADDGGFDIRGVLTRTWDSPRGASPNSTYYGVEAGMTLWYIFRVSVGVAHRLSDVPGDDAGGE